MLLHLPLQYIKETMRVAIDLRRVHSLNGEVTIVVRGGKCILARTSSMFFSGIYRRHLCTSTHLQLTSLMNCLFCSCQYSRSQNFQPLPVNASMCSHLLREWTDDLSCLKSSLLFINTCEQQQHFFNSSRYCLSMQLVS